MHYNITTYLQWTQLLVPSILQCTVIIIVSKLEKKVSYREHAKQFSTLQTGSYLFKNILETLNENVQNESIFNSTLLRIISSISSFRLLINLMS